MYLDLKKIESNKQNLIIEKLSSFHVEKELDNLKSLLVSSESTGNMGYWWYDIKSGKVWASRGARYILGVDDRELSLDYLKLIPLQEYYPQIDQIFRNLVSQNASNDFEFKIHREVDNEDIYITSNSHYNKHDNKIFGIIRDISRQKKIESELIKAKKKAEETDLFKSAFISNMSHEIRTPMNGIVGCAHLISECDLDQTARMEYKEMIHMCCCQLLGTINDVLDLASIESKQMEINYEAVNINNILKDIYENCMPVALNKTLKLGLNIDKYYDNICFQSDNNKLKKILTNLVENAIQHTHSGFVDFGYQSEGNTLIFFVKYSGNCIDQPETIFQQFCQSGSQVSMDYRGSGLALTLVQRYVNMLGGKIWLESAADSGTIFYFSLPTPKTILKFAENCPSESQSNSHRTCLIVDDIEMNFIYLKSVLTPMGFSVLWAKDGNQAIEMSLNYPEIDLVLMDIRLPYTDGYEATRKIKEKRPSLPIIAQTANALPEEREKAFASGCDDYITKPIYKDKFESLVRSFFNEP